MGEVNEVDCPTILDRGATRSAIAGRLVKKTNLQGAQ